MQTVERPRFRQDLVAEAIEEGGQKFIDVADPDAGTMFRFYEVEFSLACGMDGERDVAGIITWAKEELGLMPTAHEVRTVIATLGQNGFLDQGAAARVAATARPAPAAAAAARDAELAAGVVVGQQQKRPAAPSVDLELGSAGTPTPAPAQPMPRPADIDLGAPGAVAAAPTKSPRVPVEDVALGAPGVSAKPAAAKPDVSLDLADHMGLAPSDVKEAVRQSKQMSAVDVPKELIAQVEAPVPPPKVEAAKAATAEARAADAMAAKATAPAAKPVEAKPAEAKPAEAKTVEAKPAEKPAEKVAQKPAEKVAQKPAEKVAQKPAEKVAQKPAEKPVVVAEKKPIPTAPRSGVSPVLIILLVLVVGGAGAYFAWRYLIRDKAEQTSDMQPPPVTPGSAGSAVAAPTPPPAPPAPKAKIEVAPGAERDILSVFAGTIESIDTTERDVDTSDVIAKLVGAKRLEAEMAVLDKEIERRKTALDNAQAAREKLNPAPPPAPPAPPAEGSGSAEGSAAPPPPPAPPAKQPSEAQLKAADAAVEKTQKALEDKQNERGKKEEDLEKLYVRAPFEGKLTVLAKVGQKIEENTPIAKIVPKAAPTAKFKLEKNATLDRGLAVPLKVGEKMYTCEVADSNVDATTVVCRTNNEGLKEGDEATLMVEIN